MILAILFSHKSDENKTDSSHGVSTSSNIAFMPFDQLRVSPKGYKCLPAVRDKGEITIKKGFERYFNKQGLVLLEKVKLSQEITPAQFSITSVESAL